MAREFRMGDWLIEPDLNRVRNSERIIAIEPKVLEVLICLAERPGEVFSKNQVLRTVWPDTYVSEGILSYSISELRKAFGDDARNPHIIETISRKGYRLIANISRMDPAASRRRSIAVLPFCDVSIEKDQEYFCEGITEEIISNLAKIQNLRVASRTSSYAFKGRSEDVRAIGGKLGVEAVLEGCVRKAGSRIRITAQLVQVSDGCQLWSDRFDRELQDVFAIQDEISCSIASALRVTLSQDERKSLSESSTTDLKAFDYYLRGKQFYNQYNKTGILYALRMFLEAIAQDPQYARAHAGVADCWAFLYLYAGRNEDHCEQADSASWNAIQLDPLCAEAHASRGLVLSIRKEYREAEIEFQKAIRLNASLFEAYYFYARAAFACGRPEQAIELYEKAREVSPKDYQSPLLMAQIYSDLGRDEDASEARRVGIRNVEDRLRLHPDDARALYMGANGLVALGEIRKGLEWAAQAITIDPNESMLLYNVACIQALAGSCEEALNSLERAVRNGLSEKSWIENDSNLSSLRNHPRYRVLLATLDARQQAEVVAPK